MDVYAACPCCMSTCMCLLHVHVNAVRPICPCHVNAAWPYCRPMLHSILNEHGAWTCCNSTLDFHAACSGCANMLHEHAEWRSWMNEHAERTLLKETLLAIDRLVWTASVVGKSRNWHTFPHRMLKKTGPTGRAIFHYRMFCAHIRSTLPVFEFIAFSLLVNKL